MKTSCSLCVCVSVVPPSREPRGSKSQTPVSVLAALPSSSFPAYDQSFPDPSPWYNLKPSAFRSSLRTRLHLGLIPVLSRVQVAPHPPMTPRPGAGPSCLTSSDSSAGGRGDGPAAIPRRPVARAPPAQVARPSALPGAGLVQLGAVLGIAPAFGAGVSYLVVPVAAGVLDVLGGAHRLLST